MVIQWAVGPELSKPIKVYLHDLSKIYLTSHYMTFLLFQTLLRLLTWLEIGTAPTFKLLEVGT